MAIKDCTEFNDEEVVKNVLNDSDYFSCIVNRYEQSLKRYILRISNVRMEGVEDLLQNIFLKVYLNLNEFDQGLKFSSWIYRIAHNEVISNHRKITSRPQYDFLDDEKWGKIAADFSLEASIDSAKDKELLGLILGKLDAKYQEVLVLKYLEEKDYSEIADILRKPMGTIATLINRAKKQFRLVALNENIKF